LTYSYLKTKFNTMINEELEFELPKKELLEIKDDFCKDLNQYRDFIKSNIKSKAGVVSYKDFDNIDINMMMSELTKEYGDEIVTFFNVETFLRKIYQLLDLKSKRTKESIELEFEEYYDSLQERVENYIKGDDDKSGDYFDKWEGEKSILSRRQYEDEKYLIHIELAKLQDWVLENKKRIAIVFEGRDSAGKGSTIKRFVENLNPKVYRVVALGLPTEEEKNNWFGRYEKYLPKLGEIVFFDRSWYNRAVVEPAMGYCTEDQYRDFMENVNKWESDMIDEGIILIKFWFSITQEKQIQRFELRKKSPIKYWKFSPNDEKVVGKWDVITKYKNQMFEKTSTEKSPWVIVNSNDKKIGRLNAMRYALSVIDYEDKDPEASEYYPEVISVIE
jgi:polyphosphate kinase